jgi:GNAT superfamily N-acetyltransferase
MLDLSVFTDNSFFYPVRDNSYLCFKTLGKNDRQKFLDGFKRLSKKSVYHRFFGVMKELTDEQVVDFLNTDKTDHVAWAAFDIVGDETVGVGVGRFRRSKTNPNEAELALTVIDEYQGKGVGSTLLAIMYILASKLEIEVLTGIIMSDNFKLIRRFKELGATMVRDKNEYEMRLPINQDFKAIPETNYYKIIKPILQFLKENKFSSQ